MAKQYPPGAYQCPACYTAYSTALARDEHRRIEHGWQGQGPPMDEPARLALASKRIDLLAGMVQSLRAELARKDAALEKALGLLMTLDRDSAGHAELIAILDSALEAK